MEFLLAHGARVSRKHEKRVRFPRLWKQGKKEEAVKVYSTTREAQE